MANLDQRVVHRHGRVGAPARQILAARAFGDRDQIGPATPEMIGGHAARDHDRGDHEAGDLQEQVERTDRVERIPSGHDASSACAVLSSFRGPHLASME
jgi:hypothetical protein